MGRLARKALTTCIAVAVAGSPAMAHERWVKHDLLSEFDRRLFETANAVNVGTLIGVVVVGALLLVLSARARHTETRTPKASILDWGAAALGVTYGLGLLLMALDHSFVALDLECGGGVEGKVLVWASGLVGILLILGLWARAAAWLSLALFAFALFRRPFLPFDGESVSLVQVLNYVDVVGIAVYLGVVGRGAFAVDRLLGKGERPDEVARQRAVGVLRAVFGLTLVILGLQKFLLPELPMGVVQNYADKIYEPLHALSGVSPEVYVFCASVIETTVGLLLLAGVFTRVLVVVLILLFTLTTFIFKGEVVGHLPLAGGLVVMLLEGGGSLRLDSLLVRARRVAVATAVVLFAAILGTPSCGDTQTAPAPLVAPPGGALAVVGESGHFRFSLELDEEPLELNQFFTVRTTVVDASTGTPVEQGRLTLDATMPQHGHGMVTLPKTRDHGEGRFHTVGCKLHMFGSWEFQVEFEGGGRTDRASIQFPFQPPRHG